MPVEIKELLIKAAVGNTPSEMAGNSATQDDLVKLKNEIISEVTEKVLWMLRQKNER